MVNRDFCSVLKIFMDVAAIRVFCNAPIHVINFCIFCSPEPRHTCWFRLTARVGFIAQPWGLLNDPSVIITHLKPLPPCSGAINSHIKPQNKHTISSIN
jgi:hypothetical protein